MENKFMRDVFLTELYEKMATNTKIFLVTADLGAPIIDKIKVEYSDRFLNVGIAEQNLINVSVGLALEGYIVYAYGITPFVTMRCYEQIRVNIAILSSIKELNINLIGVSVGVGYAMSGPTHHTLEDISIIKALPNIEIFSPSDYLSAKEYVNRSIVNNSPKYIRLDATSLSPIETKIESFDNGFRKLKKGSKVAIISTSFMVQKIYKLITNLNITLIDLYFINTYNKNKLIEELSNIETIITIEEGFKNAGGLDSEINYHFKDKNIINMGVEKQYTFEIGSREFVHSKTGIGEEEIIKVITEALA
jgi:transketolase